MRERDLWRTWSGEGRKSPSLDSQTQTLLFSSIDWFTWPNGETPDTGF